jgi:NitT/TauT family transport system substrate-binding protein
MFPNIRIFLDNMAIRIDRAHRDLLSLSKLASDAMNRSLFAQRIGVNQNDLVKKNRIWQSLTRLTVWTFFWDRDRACCQLRGKPKINLARLFRSNLPGGTMKLPPQFWFLGGLLLLSYSLFLQDAWGQEKIRLSHSALESSNAVWYLAQDRGLYKKYGLDADLLFIPSTTTSVSSLVAGDVQVANASGGGVASAVVAGADLVLVSCYLNSLPYELVVNESVKSAEDLKGKSVGISRVGSASDVAARALIRGLGLEPDKQVPIMQVGGPAERAASFRTGRIAGFPSPPGIIHLTKGMPFKVLISTADFQKRFEFPYICATTTKSYLARQRETVKKVLMAHIEAIQFFKTHKEDSKKMIAKYSRINNEAYLEDAYNASAKLYDTVPLVTRPGVEVQIKEAVSRKPGAQLRFEDMVDESIVRELEKSGFIDKVYKR